MKTWTLFMLAGIGATLVVDGELIIYFSALQALA